VGSTARGTCARRLLTRGAAVGLTALALSFLPSGNLHASKILRQGPARPRGLAGPHPLAATRDRLSDSGEAVQLPSDVQPGWWAAVQKDIVAAEYRVTWQDSTGLADLPAAWQAPNRAHGFQTYFTEEGIRVVPQGDEEPAWQWGLDLVGFGWRGTVQPVAVAAPRADGNRVEYSRPHLTEWYVNDRRGLEQGFTVPVAPNLLDGGAETELVIELALRGGLSAYLSEDGQAIEFRLGSRTVLRYAELKVTDTSGETLPARMAVTSQGDLGHRLVILIDAADAAWPVTVDPLATSPGWQAEGNQIGAHFGYSLAAAGDVNGDGYGDVVVGAYGFSHGEDGEGATFVYCGSPAGLASTADWSVEGNRVGAWFGSAVAGAGDVNGDGYDDVIIGASRYYNGQGNEGAAFVYFGSAAGLADTAAWSAESNQSGARLGWAVASAGDVNGDGYSDVIVGAVSYQNGEGGEGASFVWLGSASGLGAPGTPSNADWAAEGNQWNAYFGVAVAAAGDVNGDGYDDIIVGATGYQNGTISVGRVFAYYGSATGLSATAGWTAAADRGASALGLSVAAAGDVNGDSYADVIVGEADYSGDQRREGRALVYLGSGSGLAATAVWTTEGDQDQSYLGTSVACAGDVNGDGFSDVIAGAPASEGTVDAKARALVFYGSPAGPASISTWTLEGASANAAFGSSVAGAGDVNGDGYSDVAVGAFAFANGEALEGAAFLYYGSGGRSTRVRRVVGR